MTISTLLSASACGSQACFYSDSTVLTAQGSACNLIIALHPGGAGAAFVG